MSETPPFRNADEAEAAVQAFLQAAAGSGRTSGQPLEDLLGKLLASLRVVQHEADLQTQRADRAEADLLTDALTGVFNRRGWDALLQSENSRCQRSGAPACVFTIDLDELKQVNDEHGHAAGDALLKQAADVLAATTRHQDIVARIGGDEFAILAVDCDAAGGTSLLERLADAFHAAAIKASVGMASRTAQLTLEDAWHQSDVNMYAVKRERGLAASAAPAAPQHPMPAPTTRL